MGRLRDPVAGRPGDQMMRSSGDVPGTLVIHFFFIFNSETYLTYFDRLLETLQWIVVAKNLTWGSVVKFLFKYFDTSRKKLTPARICPRNIYLNIIGGTHFHWRSVKACNIAKKTCLNYFWTVILEWSFCSIELQILRLFRARSSKTKDCKFTLKCLPEAATGVVLQERNLLKISQNSQENTYARFSFLKKRP